MSRNKRCETSCKKDFTCNTLFLQPAMLKNIALRVARKVEISSFSVGALQVAKKYCERVTTPLQLAMFFSRHRWRDELQEKLPRVTWPYLAHFVAAAVRMFTAKAPIPQNPMSHGLI